MLIGNYLREKRRALGKSQEEVAEKAGIERTRLSNIENNKGDIRWFTLYKLIHDGLGMTLEEFFKEDKELKEMYFEITPSKVKESSRQYFTKQFVSIPVVEPVNAGQTVILPNQIIDWKAFESQFIKDLVSPLACQILGDSMYPIIQDGDLILIDRNRYKRMKPVFKKLYLINIPESSEERGIMVRRVKISERFIFLIPENRRGHEEIILERRKFRDLLKIILGEVVWIGRELK
ncbi:MAG: XRE family transcriptional regulator [Acidobacteriota bacterium]